MTKNEFKKRLRACRENYQIAEIMLHRFFKDVKTDFDVDLTDIKTNAECAMC